MIKLGLRVKILPGTRFYGSGGGNPKDVWGSIVHGESAWLSVKWDNKSTNNYEIADLEFEVPLETVETDGNKIYFADPDLVITNMNELLDALYPKKKYCAETFYINKATGERFQQCQADRMRSFDDIWILADTYMPDIELVDVMKGLLLYNVTAKDIESKVLPKSFSHCSTMRRIRYTNSNSSFNRILQNINCNKYDSIFTWKELFDMINIKNDADLLEFYNKELNLEPKEQENS